jgi:glycosyl transferase family 25
MNSNNLKQLPFDFILCINLKRSVERKERIIKIINEIIYSQEFDFIEACDGNDLKANYPELPDNFKFYRNWKIESDSNKYWNRELNIGEIACSISHFKSWEYVAKSNKRTLIIEDDAYFCEDFLNKMKLIYKEYLNNISSTEIDFLYLGRNDLLKEFKMLTENICIPSFSYRSHAYIITPRMANILINSENFKNNLIPVDEFLPTIYCDHLREDIKTLFPNMRLKAFAVEPSIVFQLEDVDSENVCSRSLIENTDLFIK